MISRNHNNSLIKRAASILLAVCVLLGSASFFGAPVKQNAYADDSTSTIKQGDVLRLKSDDWKEEYIVLDPERTSTNRPGSFLLQKDVKEKTAFNYDISSDEYLEVANIWEGSKAQDWCTAYYNKLPSSVKNNIIGVKSNETESGTDWAGVNNIDGTRTGRDKAKDKVFFLSFIEYDSHKDIDGLANGVKWHLRSPYACGDLAVYVCVVTENGRVLNFGYTDDIGARPAMNLDLKAFENASKCKHGKTATWVINGENKTESYSDVQYSWAADNSKCTATGVCDNCGEKVSETVKVASKVAKPATSAENGVMTHTAAFSDQNFEMQTRTSVINKLKGGKAAEITDKSLPRINVKGGQRAKRSITAKWKKLSKKNQRKVQGIEVQCAADKGFSKIVSAKTVRKNKTKAKIAKLGRKKTYWIRIRTYKYVGKVKHVSAWTKGKRIKTK